MTGDAQAKESDGGAGERDPEQTVEGDDEQEPDDERERDAEREWTDSERDDREQNESERTPTRARTPMSEPTTDTDRRRESSTDSALRTNLYRAALALFGLLAVVAVIQLYASVNATINTFVASEYRSLFRAAFNLVVLLVSGIGISWCVRELNRE